MIVNGALLLLVVSGPSVPEVSNPEPHSDLIRGPQSNKSGAPQGRGAAITEETTNAPIFVANRGQWNPRVKFLGRRPGVNVWITSSGITYEYYTCQPNGIERPVSFRERQERPRILKEHVVRVEFVGGRGDAKAVGQLRQTYRENYFIGNDKSRWVTDVPTYASIRLSNVYRGIDLVAYFDGRSNLPRYDFVVHPEGNPSVICLRYRGAAEMCLGRDGALKYKTSLGEVEERDLVAYEAPASSRSGGCLAPSTGRVEANTTLDREGNVRFHVSRHNRRNDLVLDPLVWCSFLGGPFGESSAVEKGITVDAAGAVYVSAVTTSHSFPTTAGAFQRTIKGYQTSAITKFRPDGAGIVYSTYLSGTTAFAALIYPGGIAVDASGDVYVDGRTTSLDFPTTKDAFQSTYPCALTPSGDSAVYVAKLSPTGNKLIYSTFLGGNNLTSNTMQAYVNLDNTQLALDPKTGEAYVSGTTIDTNFPTTAGAAQGSVYTYAGFVTKLQADGAGLVYSSLFCGRQAAYIGAMTVDAQGNAYVGGSQGTYSPTTGYFDAFIARLSADGSQYDFVTHVGSPAGDGVVAVALDPTGAIYVLGLTGRPDFQTTPGAYQTTSPADYNRYLCKFAPNGTALEYSTYLGIGQWSAGDLRVDAFGQAYVFGSAYLAPALKGQLPLQPTAGAIQPYPAGPGNTGIWVLSADGSKLIYGSYLGGADLGQDAYEDGLGCFLAPNGRLYVAGVTCSIDFPTTPGAFQAVYDTKASPFLIDQGQDAFVAVVDFTPSLALQYSNPLPIGGRITGTVYLPEAAPAKGADVNLASDSGLVVVPKAVRVAAGSTSATFSMLIAGVGAFTSANVRATYGSLTVTRPLVLAPPSLAGSTLTLKPMVTALGDYGNLPGTYGGEGILTGTVTLTGPAGAGGYPVNLSTYSNSASVPHQVVVPEGKTSVAFSGTTSGVSSVTYNFVMASALYSDNLEETDFYVLPVTERALTLSAGSVFGGNAVTGQVWLAEPAPPTGLKVALSSSDPKHARVSPSVTVPGGKESASVTVDTFPIATAEKVSITGAVNGTSESATITILAPTLHTLDLSPTSVFGGFSATGQVALGSIAQTGGDTVTLSSSDPVNAAVPPSVLVSANGTTGTFTVKTKPIAKSEWVTITASLNGKSLVSKVAVEAFALKSASVSPTTVVGGSTTPVTLTVTINAPAPAGGIAVALVSSNSAASVVATGKIPAGQTTATFTIKTQKVAKAVAVFLKASLNGGTAQASLQVTAG